MTPFGLGLGSAPGLGDHAGLLAAQRQNAALRGRLATLSQEMATGQAADLARRLGGDRTPLDQADRGLALAEAFGRAAAETGGRLALMQAALGQVDAARAGLLGQIATPASASAASAAAREAFDAMVQALGTQAAGGSLFAGAAPEGPAIADAGTLMAAIRAAATGATTAADVAAALDAWFDDPAGFATTGYLGAGTDATRLLAEGEALALPARADDPALRAALKAAALGALAADPALPLAPEQADALVALSRDRLLSAAEPLVGLRAEVGRAEERAEAAQARHAATASALGLLRTEMTAVDPYETATALEAVRLQLQTHYELTSRLASLSLAGFLR